MEKFATVNHARHFFRMIIVTIFVVLIGTIVYATVKKKFTSSKTNNSSSQNNSPASAIENEAVITPLVFNPNKPWLSFTIENSKVPVMANQTSSFIVKGFSEGKNIEGYDILFNLNPSIYEIVSIESVHKGFQIYQFRKTSHVTVTGVKQLSLTTPTVLAETPLLRITIKPKTKGSIIISFIDSVKKEQTKFVDEQVNVINPQLQSLTVEIK